MDGKMAMVVLPAPQHVNFDQLKKQLGVSTAELATESEFQGKSPGCEVGAMPPFGNLYGMDIHVSKRLTEDKEIAFNAGFPYGIDKTLVQGF